MKAWLLHDRQDFARHREALWNEPSLVQDLELSTVYRAMSGGDDYLYDVVRNVMPVGLVDIEAIRYRQSVLADCLDHEAVVRQLYAIAVEAIERERKGYFFVLTSSASSVLHGARDLVQAFVGTLGRLRQIADGHADRFRSPGFGRFFAMVREELTDDYFVTIRRCLKELAFDDGVLVSANPGHGNKGERYVLRRPRGKAPNLLRRMFAKRPPSRTFRIADRDENGARALSELEARGINPVANALAQSVDHIRSFFAMLRAELGFYLGCMNLHRELSTRGVPLCFPVPYPASGRVHRFDGLHDVSLALRADRRPVTNEADANGKDLVVVTGANQGGKSTFLRAIGLAQIMLQAGMFVGAASFGANLASAVLTHYRREEDASMRSGKFDEELKRMSEIVDHSARNALLLSNESFASTNEREGSAVGREIVEALCESGVKVVLVTHLYTLARGLYDSGAPAALFLRAERREDGIRTFRLVEGEPLQTSFGEDLYRQIFGGGTLGADAADAAVPAARAGIARAG